MDLEVTMGLKSIDLARVKAGLFRLGGLARSLDYCPGCWILLMVRAACLQGPKLPNADPSTDLVDRILSIPEVCQHGKWSATVFLNVLLDWALLSSKDTVSLVLWFSAKVTMMRDFDHIGLAQNQTILLTAISTNTDSGIADCEGLKQCFWLCLNGYYLWFTAFSLYLMIIPPNMFNFRYFNNKIDVFMTKNHDFEMPKMEVLRGPNRVFLRSWWVSVRAQAVGRTPQGVNPQPLPGTVPKPSKNPIFGHF